ncbi:hypothetical protein CRUP_011512, partial [Coryphaenoides rupestris]
RRRLPQLLLRLDGAAVEAGLPHVRAELRRRRLRRRGRRGVVAPLGHRVRCRQAGAGGGVGPGRQHPGPPDRLPSSPGDRAEVRAVRHRHRLPAGGRQRGGSQRVPAAERQQGSRQPGGHSGGHHYLLSERAAVRHTDRHTHTH